MIEWALDSAYARYEREFTDVVPSSLKGEQLNFVKTLAQQGVRFAQKLLQEREINLPAVRSLHAKSFRSGTTEVATPRRRPPAQASSAKRDCTMRFDAIA